MSETTEAKPARINLHFGALVDTIAEQLAVQVERLPDPITLEHIQKDAAAITRLHIRGMLTDAEAHRARSRLMKRITKEVPHA